MEQTVTTANLDATVAALGDAVNDVRVFRDEVTLITTKGRVVEVLTHLRDAQHFDMLTDETCVDYLPKEPRFAIVYQLYSTSRNIRVRVKVMLSEYDRSIPTGWSARSTTCSGSTSKTILTCGAS